MVRMAEGMRCDIWNGGISSAVLPGMPQEWDSSFTESGRQSTTPVLRTKNNFLYMRVWETLGPEYGVEMFACTLADFYTPKNSWIRLRTDCGDCRVAVCVHEAAGLSANRNPFVLSGLYDWNGYIIAAHAGVEPYELQERIEPDFLQQPDWASFLPVMDSKDPFVAVCPVPAGLLRHKRLHTTIVPANMFAIEVSDSMRRRLDIAWTDDGISYNGVGTPRVLETITVYLTLKENYAVPDNIQVTTAAENTHSYEDDSYFLHVMAELL